MPTMQCSVHYLLLAPYPKLPYPVTQDLMCSSVARFCLGSTILHLTYQFSFLGTLLGRSPLALRAP